MRKERERARSSSSFERMAPPILSNPRGEGVCSYVRMISGGGRRAARKDTGGTYFKTANLASGKTPFELDADADEEDDELKILRYLSTSCLDPSE